MRLMLATAAQAAQAANSAISPVERFEKRTCGQKVWSKHRLGIS